MPESNPPKMNPEFLKRLLFQGYMKKAEQGDADAAFNAGIGLLHGIGTTRDTERASQLFRQAAEAGNAKAQFQLGYCLHQHLAEAPEGTDRAAEALKWFLRAAEQGVTEACFAAGVCLSQGEGAPKDERGAFQWYLKAAEAGHVGAMVNLGLSYYRGQGVHPSENQALVWLKKAADAGDAEAIDLFEAMEKEKREEAKQK